MKQAIIAIALCLALLITGCQTPTGNVIAQDNIETGVLAILTGPGTTWGQSTINGVKIAIDEINANGGINGKLVTLVIEDTHSDAKTALTAYRKLHDVDNINFIIGTSWSHEAVPITPLAANDDIVMISPSLGVEDFNVASDNLFNLWPHDALLSEEMANLVFDQGHRKVAVFSTQNVWVTAQTEAFVKKFEELGGTVIIENPPQDARTLQTELTRIKQANVDAVMITNTITGDIAAKRLKELDVDKPLFGITMGADTIAASDGAMDGMIFLSSLTPTEEFAQKYESRYPNDVLDVGADTGYDAVMLLVQAMQETQSEEPAIVAQYLNNLSIYEGVSGHLVFDGAGGVTKEFTQFIVKEGVAQHLQ